MDDDAPNEDVREERHPGDWQYSLGGLFALMTAASVALAIRRPTPEDWHLGPILDVTLLVLMFLGVWKVFRKAGQPGWSGWWAAPLLVPVVNLIVYLGICVGVADRFGRGPLFGAGPALFPQIFYPVLGFGLFEYQPGRLGSMPLGWYGRD